jgi:mannose-1-phosphate guanylyltransferase
VEDLIIIDTGDALLVCKRGRSQDVKEVSDFLRRKKMTEYL